MTDEKILFSNDNAELLESLFDEITDLEVAELGINIESDKFAITNDSQANFFLRRVEEIRNEKDKIDNTCNNEIEKFTAKVNSFRAKELNTLSNTENYLSTLLEKYADAQLKDSKKKSIKLPFGTLAFKTSPAKYVYEDDKLLKFVKNNKFDNFIRIKEEINKVELKTQLTVNKDGSVSIDGLIVEGVIVNPGEVKFSIK